MMMETMPMDQEISKKREAMKKRMAGLGEKNPVVMAAMDMQDPPMEDKKYKNWEIVDELVRAARKHYMDEKDCPMSECVADLADALLKLSNQKGIDK